MALFGGASLALAAVINGDAGDDRLTGTVKRDVVRGFAGDDEIDGRRGPDVLYGNDDSDAVYGGGGNNKIYGNRGDDSGTILPIGGEGGGLFGGTGNDEIYGGPGDDLLYDENGVNFMNGGGGNDGIVTTDFSNDRDRIVCGRGRDYVLADTRDRIANDCERVFFNAIP